MGAHSLLRMLEASVPIGVERMERSWVVRGVE